MPLLLLNTLIPIKVSFSVYYLTDFIISHLSLIFNDSRKYKNERHYNSLISPGLYCSKLQLRSGSFLKKKKDNFCSVCTTRLRNEVLVSRMLLSVSVERVFFCSQSARQSWYEQLDNLHLFLWLKLCTNNLKADP